jgi:hypothetical protein
MHLSDSAGDSREDILSIASYAFPELLEKSFAKLLCVLPHEEQVAFGRIEFLLVCMGAIVGDLVLQWEQGVDGCQSSSGVIFVGFSGTFQSPVFDM